MPGETVFVVDDDDAVRSGLQFLLRTAGYTVEAFASPAAFLAAYDPAQGGCLLLDMQMPNVTGLELQRELKRIQRARRLDGESPLLAQVVSPVITYRRT
jgi:FixJ family two-component response regulator